jgi:hypothetical protein
MKRLNEIDIECVVRNARITKAEITFDRDVFLGCWLYLGFDGYGQGFGGYVLGGKPKEPSSSPFPAGDHANQPNLAGHFIAHIMRIGDVEEFSKLQGKIIRVAHDKDKLHGSIIGIGHAVEDKWFFPELELAEIQNKGE